MVQPYPSSGSDTKQVTSSPSGPAPQPVLNAVKLMYAGAAVTTVSFIVTLVTISGLKSAIRRAYPHYTAGQVNHSAQNWVILIVVSGVIGIALWLWMARKNGEGRYWARMVGTVLFAINTLDMITVFRGPKTFTVVFPVLVWLIGAAAVYLLWQPASIQYFNASRAPRR